MTETRLQVTLCNCGQAFRGRNYQLHLNSLKAKNLPEHSWSRRMHYCTACRKTASPISEHRKCSNVPISKSDMLVVVNGGKLAERLPEVTEQLPVATATNSELQAALASIALPVKDFDVDIDKSSLSSISSASNSPSIVEISPLAASTPKADSVAGPSGICTFRLPSNPSKEAIPVNLQAVNHQLGGVNRRLKGQLECANQEIAFLKETAAAKAIQQAQHEKALTEKIQRLEDELQQMRQEKEQAEEKASMAENNRKEAVDFFAVTRKAWDSERDAIAKTERKRALDQMQPKTFELHIPLRENRVLEQAIIVENLDETHECFDSPQHGVTCLHGSVVAAQLSSIYFRRPAKKRLPSKYLKSIVISFFFFFCIIFSNFRNH